MESPTVGSPAVESYNGETYSTVLQWSPAMESPTVESCSGVLK